MANQDQKLPWLQAYGGQTLDQLLSLEGQYRIDSLICVYELALCQKEARVGKSALGNEERLVLAVEALEREVNNGGYAQFFQNSSREYASLIVDSLRRIGCADTAALTQRAIDALGTSDLSAGGVKFAMTIENSRRDAILAQCDNQYFKSIEPIAEILFAFIKSNKSYSTLP